MRIAAGAVPHRIYADFLMPSRLPQFRHLLESFLDAGYSILSIEAYWDLVKTAGLGSTQRIVILRHDIDTDPRTGRRMWEIERELGAVGSFFFRLSTLDLSLMSSITESGGHASYHYEEVATVAKRYRLRGRVEVERHLGEIRDEFHHNLASLRAQTGLPLSIVASHGDFVNRRLGIPNWYILSDADFRREVGVELETYDAAVMENVTSRHSDTLYPRFWLPEDPRAALARGEAITYLLVHPRHWRVARWANAKDDVTRFWQSVLYGLPPGPERGSAA